MIKVDRWEVYSKLVCATFVGKLPLIAGAPIHVYEVPSTLINPAHPVAAPLLPATGPGLGPLVWESADSSIRGLRI
jgi:hypothetical protein